MIREDRFLISRRPYAVDLSSLKLQEHTRDNGTHFYSGGITAVWYRRRRGVTVACVGSLWDFQDAAPADGIEFLARHDDGRYGGSCAGRWDGENYWGAQKPSEIEEHLTLLRPMLDSYPAIPPGYDGWWRF
jgi:hypothetical protein